MRKRHLGWLSLGLVLSTALPRVAGAAEPALGVVEVRVDGKWPGVANLRLDAAVASGLEGLERFSTTSAGAADCNDAACWSAHAQSVGASHLLSIAVSIVDRDVDVRLEVYEGRTGNLVASSESSCEVCADNEVAEMLTATTARLRPRIDALYDQGSTLVVDGSPRTAEVLVDGRVVGPAPFRGPVTPGDHEIVVTAEGYRPFQARAYAEPGETKVVEYVLSVRPSPETTEGARLGRLGYGGIGALAVGAGALATGITLLVLHGSPVESSCPGGMRDVNGRCPRMYDTRAGGAVAVSIGGVAVVAGVTLLVLDRVRPRRVGVAVGPRGLAIRGSF